MAAKVDVQVTGLREFNRNLKALDPALQKSLRDKLKTVALRIAAKVVPKIPRRTGRAAASVKAGADMKSAYVKAGSARVPYYGWLDYGGTLKPTGERYNTQQRPVMRQGRYLYPEVVSSRPESLRAAEQAFEEAVRDSHL